MQQDIEDIKKQILALEKRVEKIETRNAARVYNNSGADDLLEKAKEIVMKHDKASASLLQRRLSIGYARAARLLDQLEEKGIVGSGNGSQLRDVICE